MKIKPNVGEHTTHGSLVLCILKKSGYMDPNPMDQTNFLRKKRFPEFLVDQETSGIARQRHQNEKGKAPRFVEVGW